MRKHCREMIRFANSKPGTKVWFKYSNLDWTETSFPSWYENNYIYVVDDEYAEIRKKSIDTERPIQVKDSVTDKWITPSYELNFELPLENYRLEPEKFSYPIYKKNKITGYIVKFIGLSNGVIIEHTDTSYIGYTSHTWIKHNDTRIWKDVESEKSEPEYYYKWEKLYNNELIDTTTWVSNTYAKNHSFKANGWRKIEDSKRTWEEDNNNTINN